MTKDEAMKLAQEVCPYTSEELRGAFYEGFIKALNHVPDPMKMIEPDMGIDRGAWGDVPDATKWVDELRGGDETEQEPVAWIDEFGNVFPLGAQRGPKYLNEPMKPLYTAPPKRKWQGLTQEDIPDEYDPVFDSDEFIAGMAWAQAKLKEKNHD